jgi:hypothetical protein
VKITSCGCSYHARCMPLQTKNVLKQCPSCNRQVSGISLYPMTFDELDDATKAAADSALKANKRGIKKRKNSILTLDDVSSFDDGTKFKGNRKRSIDESKDDKESADCRTGRWTPEEIVFCDQLINLFKDGNLPLAAGTKLNDFLASMLKSKQSRLTKKMKNAKLSSKIFEGTACFITDTAACSEFSQMEEHFFQAINDLKERSELRFYMRKEWREMFSNYCLQIGQPIDADAWLSSVEEMDRRVSIARDATRIARRKLMMGYALCQDYQSAPPGVFIERSHAEITAAHNNEPLKSDSNEATFNTAETDEVLALLDGDFNDKADSPNSLNLNGGGFDDFDMIGKSSILQSSPFLSKVMAYIKRHNVPFEHVDVWVPNAQNGMDSKVLLGFAGCATAETEICGRSPPAPLESDDKFNLLAFGDYSQKFSFAEGCGLPGRVFTEGVPVWEERGYQNSAVFERCGGASQWGVRSVVGIPLPSPNVGRIVICLYSRHERVKDEGLISRLQDEFAKLLPTPKWKLVIDMSTPVASGTTETDQTSFPYISSSSSVPATETVKTQPKQDQRINEIIGLLGEEMFNNMMASNSGDMVDLTGLRLFLLKSSRSPQEEDTLSTVIGSYSSYVGCGRSKTEVATMLSRDFTFLMQTHQAPASASYTNAQYASAPQQAQYSAAPFQPYPTWSCNQYPSYNNSSSSSYTNFSSSSATEMSLAPSDPSMLYYPIQDGPGLDNFRSHSPALTPIVPFSGSGQSGDNLSVVSN